MTQLIAVYSGEKSGTGKTSTCMLMLLLATFRRVPVVYIDLSIDIDYLTTLLAALFRECRLVTLKVS